MRSRRPDQAVTVSGGVARVQMRLLLQHRSKAEDLAVAGLVDHHFLLVFIHRRDPHPALGHDVGAAARFAHFVDPLTGCELLDFNLFGKDGEFLVIQQGKQRDVFQFFRVAGHAHLLLKLGVV